jgi:putative CocE/NonD family hydrolase
VGRKAYSGSAREYDVAVEQKVFVDMRDGVRLACDVYRPAIGDTPVEGSFPTVLERTPYNRARSDLFLTGNFFASRGYNVVYQDCRGCYDSEGLFKHFFDDWNEAFDGHDTVEWIAKQPWSDGKVGTTGLSFTGANQQALAITKPPHLTTQIILDAGYNYWRRTGRQSGAFTQGIFFPQVFWQALASREARESPAVRAALRDALDNLHEWTTRLPLKRGESPLALAPSWEDWYFDLATRADYDEGWQGPLPSLENHIDKYPDIPICLVASWYGHHVWANFEKYNRFREQNTQPVKLLVGVWGHGFRYMAQTWAGEVEFGNAAAMELDDFRLRWFDQWLKGIDTGVAEEPPLRIFVMGGGDGAKGHSGRMNHGGFWRDASEWPLPGTGFKEFYFHADGALATEPPVEADTALTFVFDPSDPVPTLGGEVQDPLGGEKGVIYGGAFNQTGRLSLASCRDTEPLSSRTDVLAFRSAPFDQPTELTGPVRIRAWVSSSARDTDFTFKLVHEYPPNSDYPRGFAMNLADSIVRMRYRNNRPTAELIEPGEIYEIELELQPRANIFGVGHRMRVDVSSSSFPQFDVNPNTGAPLDRWLGSVVAQNTLHLDTKHPTHIVAPIYPGDDLR